jgi:hypothetical protein
MSYFLILGGLTTSTAFDASVGLSGLMLIGNMFGWVFVERFGRRGTALWGWFSISDLPKYATDNLRCHHFNIRPSHDWYHISYHI